MKLSPPPVAEDPPRADMQLHVDVSPECICYLFWSFCTRGSPFILAH